MLVSLHTILTFIHHYSKPIKNGEELLQAESLAKYGIVKENEKFLHVAAFCLQQSKIKGDATKVNICL